VVSEWPMLGPAHEPIATARRQLEAALGGIVQMLTRLRREHREGILTRIGPHLDTARAAAERLAALEGQPPPKEQ